jgi:hypothetical protein
MAGLEDWLREGGLREDGFHLDAADYLSHCKLYRLRKFLPNTEILLKRNPFTDS